jgi:hypothetical protein
MGITRWVVRVVEDIIVRRVKCLPDPILGYGLVNVIQSTSKVLTRQ